MSFTSLPSDIHISTFASQGNPRALHRDRVTLAYDRLKFPTLVTSVQAESLDRRRNALALLRDELGPAESFALAADAGAAHALVAVLSQSDDLCRERACSALLKVCGNASGRRHMLHTEGALEGLGKALTDRVRAHRESLLAAVAALAEEEEAVDALVGAGYVALLTTRAGQEDPKPQALCLMALGHLLQQVGGTAVHQALERGLMQLCVRLCTAGSTSRVRQRALANVAYMAVCPEGKHAALHAHAVPAVCAALADPGDRVPVEAALALANITVLDEAKATAIEHDAVPLLVALLCRPASADGALLNTMKALANLCAHPAGRAALLTSEALATLSRLRRSSDAQVVETADGLAKLISWEP